jgi:hypothetical protein
MSLSLITILFVTTLLPAYISFPLTDRDGFDLLLLEVDQNGTLVKNASSNTNVQSNSAPYWGKITELATGGFAIAGFHESDYNYYRQLLVMRTDEDYNLIWNRTYGFSFDVRAITEMNNGDLAIAHYTDCWEYSLGTFEILVIDNEGNFVKKQSWQFSSGHASGFSHCKDGGFVIAKEIYNTPDGSPFWIARIDTDLNIVWNKTYPSFATHSDILEDMDGGFTMPLEPGLDGPIGIVRLNDQGIEVSRVFTDSTETRQYLTLTQCSNGEYLAGGPNYILRFDIEGNILWEKNVGFYVHRILELSPDRFVAFEAAGARVNGWDNQGVYLECFDAGGHVIWTRSAKTARFFVSDVICNTDGGLTLLGMVEPDYLSSVLYAITTEAPDDFDVLLMDVDQDGNLLQDVSYDTNVNSGFIPYWGKITQLATGGFAIAGFLENGINNRQLWVIRTDENYNPIWNRTYGYSFEVRAITEMNNGDLAIGHYITDYGYEISTFQILVIDEDGDFVNEKTWRFGCGHASGFSHCEDGGFVIAKEIYNTPGASPFWIARIDTDLNVVWNNTYPSFATHSDIFEDMAGGFTMPLEPGLDGPIGIVRLDSQGNEVSRVFTDSTETRQYLTLTQCSNGEYLAGGPGYLIRFDIEGNIMWEKNVGFYVHGILELSPERFVAFEAAGMRINDWDNPGVYLECFDDDGEIVWIRSVYADGFFVPDIICNADGGLTILGMMASNYPSVLDDEWLSG